jgi:hemerythrin-like domain-containing protein
MTSNYIFILFHYNVEIILSGQNVNNIKEYLANDHRRCDDLFAQMEAKANSSLADTKELTEAFVADMERHFQREERVVFPEFEAKTGMLNGPTEMMRQEHAQMRNLMQQFFEAIEEDNKDKFFGIAETLMILLQQHNMKEEQMLYALMQQHLSAEAEHIIGMMDSLVVE